MLGSKRPNWQGRLGENGAIEAAALKALSEMGGNFDSAVTLCEFEERKARGLDQPISELIYRKAAMLLRFARRVHLARLPDAIQDPNSDNPLGS